MNHLLARARRLAASIPRPVRIWLYGVSAASGPLLVHYDLIEAEVLPFWCGFLLALLNINDPDDESGDA